jgi:hypothetical protein
MTRTKESMMDIKEKFDDQDQDALDNFTRSSDIVAGTMLKAAMDKKLPEITGVDRVKVLTFFANLLSDYDDYMSTRNPFLDNPLMDMVMAFAVAGLLEKKELSEKE